MISKEITKLEETYENEIEERIFLGQIHPRLIRWYQEDCQNDQPIDSKTELINRYSICKECGDFNSFIKICKICNCFMPLKVQIKKSKCPKEKW